MNFVVREMVEYASLVLPYFRKAGKPKKEKGFVNFGEVERGVVQKVVGVLKS